MNKFLSLVAISSLFMSSIAFADGIDSADNIKNTSGEKSGLFIGVHGGVTLFGLSGYDTTQDGVKPIETSFNIGLKVGYQQFFMPLFGMRTYLGYDFYGSRNFALIPTLVSGSQMLKLEFAEVSFHNVTFNADMLFNFINNDNFTFGVYIGLGLGYGISSLYSDNPAVDKGVKQLEKSLNYSGFNIPINVGVTATFAKHHKVELGTKIQALGANYTYTNPNTNITTITSINPYVINIGYSHIF